MTNTSNARKIFIFFFLFATLFCLLSADFAEARRLGGGRSFGSRKSFSKPAQKPSPTRDSKTTQQSGMQQKRPGGMGGMLGGLLVGSMLGGLLFGGGMGGGNIMDLLLIGGGLFLLLRFLRSRKPATNTAGAYGTGGGGPPPRDHMGPGPRPPEWAGGASDGWSGLRTPPPAPDSQPQDVSVPADFDEAEFIEGAKKVYNRLQTSWDKRDLDDIATFVAPEVYNEIAEQAAQDPEPGTTEILMLDARLLEVKEQDGETMATVFYDALLREDAGSGSPDQVREVWHFTRPDASEHWKLAGIQQLED